MTSHRYDGGSGGVGGARTSQQQTLGYAASLDRLGEKIDSLFIGHLQQMMGDMLDLLFGLRKTDEKLSVWDIGPGDRGEDKRAFGAAFNLLDAPEPVVSSVSQQQVLSGLSGSKAMPAAPRSEGGKLFRKILDWDAQGRDTTYRVNLSVPSTPSSRQWMQAQFPRLQVSVAGSPAGQPSFAGPYEMLAQVEINSLQYFFLVFASAFGDQHKTTAQQAAQGRDDEHPDANCRFALLQRYLEYFVPILQRGKNLSTTAAQSERVLAALVVQLFDELDDPGKIHQKLFVNSDQLVAVTLVVRQFLSMHARPPSPEFELVVQRHLAEVGTRVFCLLRHLMTVQSRGSTANFLFVVELMRKFCRPWRYAEDDIEFSRAKWGQYVQVNFPVYTTIFRIFLHYVNTNLTRIAQEKPQEQYKMLSRVSSILAMYEPLAVKAEANLPKFIASLERDYVEVSSTTATMLSSFRQNLMRLEGEGYVPVFYQPPAPRSAAEADAVAQMQADILGISRLVAQIAVEHADRPAKSSEKGLLKWLVEDASPRRHRNYSAERDRQKLVRECAVVQEILPAVFPDLAEKLAAVKSEVQEGAGLHTLEPAALAERRAAEQYAKRKAKRLELYQHALLQPVRSYESAVVVRWTIRLSAWLNNKYGPSPWMQPAPQSAKNAVLGADATGPPSQCPFAMCQDGDRLRLFVSQDEEVVVDEVEQTPSGLRLAGALAERAGGWQWADQARVTYFADVLELVTFYSQFPYDGTHTLLVPPPSGGLASKLASKVFPLNLRVLASSRFWAVCVGVFGLLLILFSLQPAVAVMVVLAGVTFLMLLSQS